MASLAGVLNALDGGIDGNFAATLAGLALAAAAFYAPVAERIATESQRELHDKEAFLDRGHRQGYGGLGTDLDREIQSLRARVANSLIAQESLIKAFVVLVGLVAYSITVDEIISIDLLSDFGTSIAELFVGADTLISALILGWAGKNLLQGAASIGNHFQVSFDSEREQLEKYRTALQLVLKDAKRSKE